ncbi:unnamed protein product [Trichobilharzia regenti]|nr:unnamed protein product [Trichobilharzia regenti]
MTNESQRSGCRESFMVSSNPYKLSECDSFRWTSPTARLQVARKTRSCLTRLQEVHARANCESATKFSGKPNVKSASSRSDSEWCGDNGAVKKPEAATGKPLLNRVSQTTLQFVQENRVTVSESSSDSTILQDNTSQREDIKPIRICEEESKLSTVAIKEFENDEVDQIDDGKVDVCDNDHDSALLSLADHDEMRDMPTTAKLNKGSVQLERGVEMNADAVAEGMDTCETVSVIDQRVVHLSSDASAKPEQIVKDSSGGSLAVRQLSESRTTTASDPPLSSSTCVT